jgi:hypothetical protein
MYRTAQGHLQIRSKREVHWELDPSEDLLVGIPDILQLLEGEPERVGARPGQPDQLS